MDPFKQATPVGVAARAGVEAPVGVAARARYASS
jgi:hypothetical protein